MGWIFLILLMAGSVVAYRWLVTVEAEIRAEIAAAEQVVVPPAPVQMSSESRILSLIRTRPGILQAELYTEFPDLDRKVMQKELLKLDRSGKISRKKSGNTYQLSSLD